MVFGLAHLPIDPHRTVAILREAERLGFDHGWLPDQNFHPDAFTLLAAAAGQTQRIGLGLGVTNPFSIHPAITARMAATVQELSGGRLILGYGTGNKREYLAPLGHDGRRGVERCREAVRVTRSLVRNEEVRHRSDLFVCDGVKLRFTARPVPIFVAGIGPRILRVAGEVADGAIINYASPQGLRYGIQAVRAGATEAGRPASGLRIVCWAACFLTDEPQAAYDLIRGFIAHTIAPTADEVLRHLGIPEDAVGPIRRAYREGGPEAAARHASDAMCDTWVMIGDGPTIVDRIRHVREAGATDVAILPWTRDGDEVLETARRFSREVLPNVA